MVCGTINPVVTVRPASPADAAELADLLEAAIRDTYAPFAQSAVYEAVIAQTCTPAAMTADITAGAADPRNTFLVAVDDDALVGFLDFVAVDEGLELRRLYLAVGHAGRGVGVALLSTLEDQLPAGTAYRAVVHVENSRALAFWRRNGFLPVGHVDTRDHFADHRGLDLSVPSEPEMCVILERVVGAPRAAAPAAPTALPRSG